MFCEKCGTELNDDAVFCSKCGRRTQGADEGSPQAPVEPPARKAKSPWPILFTVILLAILASGAVFLVVSNQKAATAKVEAEADKAIEAVGQINAAVGVGVTYQNYMTQLSGAAAGVENYEPSDATGTSIRRDLAKSVLYYQAAGEAWNAKIQDDYIGGAQYKSKYPELEDIGYGSSADDIMQAAWVVAGAAYDQAKRSAASYDN